MPRVSVIIPAHNAARFLPETLGSVSDQTFTDWEVVIVDDGSTDDTPVALADLGPGFRALRNEVAMGPAGARNRALENSTGELVVFLDADDLLLPAFLEQQVAVHDDAVKAGRRVGLVACDAHLLDGDSYAPYTYMERFPDRDVPLTFEMFLRRNRVYGACLVPTVVGQSVGWFDHELFGTEDFGLWLKILERGYEAIVNPEPLAVYRRHPGTVSSNLARQAHNVRLTYELTLARGALNPKQTRIARKAVRYNRAIEEIATVRFGSGAERTRLPGPRVWPLLLRVALTNPRLWGQWLSILTGGGDPVVAGGRRRR